MLTGDSFEQRLIDLDLSEAWEQVIQHDILIGFVVVIAALGGLIGLFGFHRQDPTNRRALYQRIDELTIDKICLVEFAFQEAFDDVRRHAEDVGEFRIVAQLRHFGQ